MELAEPFVARMTTLFGDAGRAWLAELPQLLARCRDRWALTDLAMATELSYNLILFAESPVYGPVVLKLGVPNPELMTEITALALYGGRSICRCYEADERLGALLLERVLPGHDLRSVTDDAERFRIAADLIATLPIPLQGGHGLPTYGEWVQRAFHRVRREPGATPELLALVAVADRLFHEEISGPDGPHLLLHGDLHHQNILEGLDGLWKAIDPKGVLGFGGLEAARFMQNEFTMGDPATRDGRLERMTTIFAARMGVGKRLLGLGAFVDKVLSTCWSVEERIAPDRLQEAVADCEALLGWAGRQLV